MNNEKEIIKEIKAVGLRVEIYSGGFNIFPNDKNVPVIYYNKLRKLIAIAQKYNLIYYIDFDTEFIRLH